MNGLLIDLSRLISLLLTVLRGCRNIHLSYRSVTESVTKCYFACAEKKTQHVQRMFERVGCRNGNTALHIAVQNGHFEIVNFLVRDLDECEKIIRDWLAFRLLLKRWSCWTTSNSSFGLQLLVAWTVQVVRGMTSPRFIFHIWIAAFFAMVILISFSLMRSSYHDYGYSIFGDQKE